MTWEGVWGCNAKDAFFLFHQSSHSGLGEQIQRNAVSNRQILTVAFNGLKRFATRLLFRRVRPVEKKSYAFARNMFAILSMGLLVFRTITALIQAKNKVDVRVYSKDCGPVYMREHDVQVLMLIGSTGRTADDIKARIEVSVEANQGIAHPCGRTELSGYTGGWYPYILLTYGCNSSAIFDWTFKPRTYLITINSSSRFPLAYEDTPLVWLANKKEIIHDKRAVSPFYSTPWKPLPGHNYEIEAGLVSRGFISSPIMRDIALDTDPEYTYISLYPIATLTTNPLANATVTTARLRLTMRSGLNYIRDREPFNEVNSSKAYPLIEAWADSRACDFIEDYRSGTILDVLSSVSGLFAILQIIHVLLFGRPLLWGLSGTKLINPFGLVGAFDTKGFSRRLRDAYGREPTKENPDPIQTAAFLRDFVIDFGPLITEPRQVQDPGALRPITNRHETLNSRVPLMSVSRCNTMKDVLERETDATSSPPGALKSLDNIS